MSSSAQHSAYLPWRHSWTAAQAHTLEQLHLAGLVRHTWADNLGVASFRARRFRPQGSVPNTRILFLKNFGSPFGPPDTSDAARFIRMRTDNLGWQHFEYQHTYAMTDANENLPSAQRRLDVEGAFLSFHVDSQGRLIEKGPRQEVGWCCPLQLVHDRFADRK